MNKLKILFLCSGNVPGGIAPFIKSQGLSLEKKGAEIDYFTIKGKGIRGYLKNAAVLKQYLKKNKYHIIHAHYALCGWVAVLAFPHIPIAVSFMGCDVYGNVDKTGKRTGYIEILSSKLLQPFVRSIIVKSKQMARHVYMKKKLHIIPNGVDFDRFKPMDKTECRKLLKLPIDKKIVLFLGDPSDPRKNLPLAKEAVETLNDPEVRLLTPYPVPPDHVPLYLNVADAIILTSFLEGSPNVVKEAMACGRPIVATDVGDVAEILHNIPGCFITPFNPAETAVRLKKALDFNRPTGGRRAAAHLDERLIADRIMNIYETLTASQILERVKTTSHEYI